MESRYHLKAVLAERQKDFRVVDDKAIDPHAKRGGGKRGQDSRERTGERRAAPADWGRESPERLASRRVESVSDEREEGEEEDDPLSFFSGEGDGADEVGAESDSEREDAREDPERAVEVYAAREPEKQTREGRGSDSTKRSGPEIMGVMMAEMPSILHYTAACLRTAELEFRKDRPLGKKITVSQLFGALS